MDKSIITYDSLQSVHEQKGYVWRNGVWQLNVTGIRATDMIPDFFDDAIAISFMSPIGEKFCYVHDATTKPGDYWLQNPMNPLGTFILAEGQYVDSHIGGLHYGLPALVQCGNLTGYRDIQRDHQLHLIGTLYTGNNFAVNIHRMGKKIDGTTHVYNESAGCQGMEENYIEQMMEYYKQQVSFTGRQTIDYTLIGEADFH